MSEISIDIDQVPGLRELVDQAIEAGELVLLRDGRAVAKIVPVSAPRAARRPGSAQGMFHMADDFDATPQELHDYF